jgi:hypothetical protein
VVNPQRVFYVGIQVVIHCALKKINIYLKKVIKKYYTNIKVLPLYHQESESTKKNDHDKFSSTNKKAKSENTWPNSNGRN